MQSNLRFLRAQYLADSKLSRLEIIGVEEASGAALFEPKFSGGNSNQCQYRPPNILGHHMGHKLRRGASRNSRQGKAVYRRDTNCSLRGHIAKAPDNND